MSAGHHSRITASIGLVFASINGEPLDRINLYARRYKPLLERAELSKDFTLYSLRYTYATLSLLAGEIDKVVSEQMGHSRVNFTKDVYVKVLPSMQQAALDRLENMLFSGGNTPVSHLEADQTM